MACCVIHGFKLGSEREAETHWSEWDGWGLSSRELDLDTTLCSARTTLQEIQGADKREGGRERESTQLLFLSEPSCQECLNGAIMKARSN